MPSGIPDQRPDRLRSKTSFSNAGIMIASAENVV